MNYQNYTKAELIRILMVKERQPTRSPIDVYENVLRPYSLDDTENFLVITLDAAMCVINTHVVSKGLVNRTLIHPREVFRPALLDNATSIIVAHNHPSGHLEASDDDLEATTRLRKAGNILGIPVNDHIIFGMGDYRSLAETGELI